MRCPKCGYNSFDFNKDCPKCGRDLSSAREHLGFFPFTPQPVSYIEALLNQAENNFLFEVEETESVDLGTYAEDQEVEGEGLPAEEEGQSMSLEPEDQGISFTPETDVGLSLEEEGLTPEPAAPPEEGIDLTLETEEGQAVSLEPGPAESELLEAAEETVIIEPEEIPQSAETPSDQIEEAAPVQLAVEEEGLGLDLEIAAREESVEVGLDDQVLEFEDLDMTEAEEAMEIGVEPVQGDAVLSYEQETLEITSEELSPDGALGVEETVMLEPEEIPGLEDIGGAVQEEEVGLETAVSEPMSDEVFPPAMEKEEGISLDLSEEGLTEEAALDLSVEGQPLDAESTLIIEPDEEAEDPTQLYAQQPVVESGPIEPRREKTPDQEADSDLDLTDLDFEEEPQSVFLAVNSEDQESLDLDLGDLELIDTEEDVNPDFENLDLEEKDE